MDFFLQKSIWIKSRNWLIEPNLMWSKNQAWQRQAQEDTCRLSKEDRWRIEGKAGQSSNGFTCAINHWWNINLFKKGSKFYEWVKNWNRLDQHDTSSQFWSWTATLCDRIVLETTRSHGSRPSTKEGNTIGLCDCIKECHAVAWYKVTPKIFLFTKVS